MLFKVKRFMLCAIAHGAISLLKAEDKKKLFFATVSLIAVIV